jgi:murein DD-endopeptidase MepM/ murein hydrolase activator NlpD
LRPLKAPIESERRTSEFGDRRTFLYTDGNEGGSIHHGIDFGAPTGTPVTAPGAGRVVMAKSRVITGNTVVIEHLPGVFSLYYHLDTIDVTEDAMVRTGTPLGTVGSTGLSTGPHLHWELRISAVPVDPQPFLSRPILDFRGDSGKIDTH